ncbi:MAG: hypothetical protein RL385_1296 [Pseudomonadota bacterium]|jgi:mono/diheme cytochrome c family protein
MREFKTTLAMLVCGAALFGCGAKRETPREEVPVAAPEPATSPIAVPDFVISTAQADIAKGEELFGTKGCAACHKLGGGKLVGPDLKGVTTRRHDVWLKKMILRPDVMIKEDEAAKKLFVEYLTPMPNQGVDPDSELPFLLAFLKSHE